MVVEYNCSFDFDKPEIRKKYKYLVVREGDLDINNAMMLRTQKDLLAYLKQEANYYGVKIKCIIKIGSFEDGKGKFKLGKIN